jgi:hypothetical protein
MADQTIAIRMILRDEMSKPLADIHRQIDRLAGARISGVTGHMQSFGGAMRVAHRELSALSRLAVGGLIGGGLVASIVGITKALGDMAREGLQMRYQAEALRVSPAFFERMVDGLTALGEETGQAKSSVTSLINALRDAEVKGEESALFKRLEKGVRGTGIVLWRQIREQLRGPEGAEGAFKWLIERMRDMHPTGQRALLQQLGLSSLAFKDLQEVLPRLNKRIQLSREEMLALNVANTNFQINMGNIGRQLGSAVMPGITKITKALSDYLQTQSGKKFAADLRDWSNSVADAVAKFIGEKDKEGKTGLDRALAELVKVKDLLVSAFTEADKVIQAIGLTWPQAIGGLVGIAFAAWLAGVAANLAKLVPLAPLLLALKDIMPLLGKSPEEIKDLIEQQKQTPAYKQLEKEGMIGALLKSFQDWWRSINPQLQQPQPQPQSGEGSPKTDTERRADMQEEKNQRELLRNEFAQLSTELGQLNSYFQVGGPEGTADGTSGFGAGVSGSEDSSALTPFGSGMPSVATFGMAKDSSDFGVPAGMEPTGQVIRTLAASMKLAPVLYPGLTAGQGWQKNRFWQGLSGKPSSNVEYGGPLTMPEATAKTLNLASPSVTARSFDFWRRGENIQPSFGQDWGKDIERAAGPPDLPAMTVGGGGGGANWNMPQLSPIIAGSEMQPLGGGGIIAHLARESTGPRLTGSATVDIDVGGLNASPPDPDELFRPQPLGGSVQMQNATHPRHNPLSFQ